MRNYWYNKESRYKDDAIALIEWRRQKRSEEAQRIRKLRKEAAKLETPIPQKHLNKMCRWSLRDVEKVALPFIEAERQRNLEFGGREFGPIILDDGYACCGMEDARDEQQHYAREHAKVLRIAIFALKREKKS